MRGVGGAPVVDNGDLDLEVDDDDGFDDLDDVDEPGGFDDEEPPPGAAPLCGMYGE